MKQEVENMETVEEVVETHEEETMEAQTSNDEVVEALQNEIKELQDKFMRNAAELENFKRRMNEERQREAKYRAQAVVTNIIPALDNFERALATAPADEQYATFLTGFNMIYTQLNEALKQEGVEVIASENVAFDPTVHQAVMQEAMDGVEAGIVIQEFQKGYKLKDRVIRPAMVKVSQ